MPASLQTDTPTLQNEIPHVSTPNQATQHAHTCTGTPRMHPPRSWTNIPTIQNAGFPSKLTLQLSKMKYHTSRRPTKPHNTHTHVLAPQECTHHALGPISRAIPKCRLPSKLTLQLSKMKYHTSRRPTKPHNTHTHVLAPQECTHHALGPISRAIPKCRLPSKLTLQLSKMKYHTSRRPTKPHNTHTHVLAPQECTHHALGPISRAIPKCRLPSKLTLQLSKMKYHTSRRPTKPHNTHTHVLAPQECTHHALEPRPERFQNAGFPPN